MYAVEFLRNTNIVYASIHLRSYLEWHGSPPGLKRNFRNPLNSHSSLSICRLTNRYSAVWCIHDPKIVIYLPSWNTYVSKNSLFSYASLLIAGILCLLYSIKIFLYLFRKRSALPTAFSLCCVDCLDWNCFFPPFLSPMLQYALRDI